MPSEIKSATTTAPSSSRRDRRQAPGDGQATADVKQFLLFRVRGLIADRQAFRCIRAQLFQMLLVILHGPPRARPAQNVSSVSIRSFER